MVDYMTLNDPLPVADSKCIQHVNLAEIQVELQNVSVLSPVNCCVHTQIVQRCQQAPDSAAIDSWDGTMTYSELDSYSSAVAAHLVQMGVGPEVVVPLYLKKSRWVVVAMLGVMRAGGAFVLLDASLPLKRMQFICDEVNARIVVTFSEYAAQAAELATRIVILDDRSMAMMSTTDDTAALSNSVSPGNPVYVMFTSGSTGEPKGVVIEHSAFTTNSIAYSKSLSMTSDSRVLQFAAYSFDACLIEILTTLMLGGCVCIPSSEDRLNRLAEVITDLKVNWLLLTPSVARLLSPRDIPMAGTLVLGGEPLTPADVEKWRGNVNLFNAYGPTECAAVSTTKAVSILTDPDITSTCLGSGTACITWVVNPDDHHQLMPVGSIGELLLEGPNVGRGYINRDDLNRSVFIDAPRWRGDILPGTNPCRFYKTGDLVQYTADRSLQYIGRKDTQVKLAGQRLELGEVEHQVRKYFPRAQHIVATVVPRKDITNPYSEILVVFIDHSEGQSQNPIPLSLGSEIAKTTTQVFQTQVSHAISELRKALPEYMVPSRFLPLCRVPLLESGKTDVKQLREQVQSLSAIEFDRYGTCNQETKRSPRGLEEMKLQKIWAEILGIPADQIGADDEFFELGGNSLDAMRMIASAREGGLHGLTVSAVFISRTLSALAKRGTLGLNKLQGGDTASPAALGKTRYVSDLEGAIVDNALNPRSITSLLPTTDFQRIYLAPGLKSYFVWKISQSVELDRLSAALQLLVDRYSILRTVFLPSRGGLLQVVLAHIKILLAHRSTGEQPLDDFCRTVCQEDNDASLPVGRPYLQATLVTSGTYGSQALILRSSHAQWDVETLQLLFRRLTDAYNGKEIPSPMLDFPLYMQYRLSQRGTKAYTFWKEYLHNTTITSWEGLGIGDGHRTLAIAFGSISIAQKPRGTTMATLVKAGWALTLARLTQRTDLMFGHTVNGRSLPVLGINETMGCCLNTAPIRVIIQSSWTARDMLDHVLDQYARTIDYETVDFSDIVANCTPWPQGTDFDSVVTHDHLDVIPTMGLDNKPAPLEPVHVRVAEEVFRSMSWPLQVMTAMRGPRIAVTILASSHMVTQGRVDWLVGKLSESVETLAKVESVEPLNLAQYRD
jgi:amino acid adenylation domain-containing protein